VELHRLEAVGHDHEVAGDHAMEPYRRFVDRAFDAELGEDHQQTRRDAGQGKQRAGALALELLHAERHDRGGARRRPHAGQREIRPPVTELRHPRQQAQQPKPQRRYVRQDQSH
jgi:hypothetical protein